MKNLTDQPTWKALQQHYQEMAALPMRDLFMANTNRCHQFSIQAHGISLDYSRNRITAKTMQLLGELASNLDVKAHIQALFDGSPVNTTEHRPALHPALRKETLAHDTQISRDHLYQFVNDVQTSSRTGITGKPFKHIVNIGIGGSYLGPKMCTEALKDFATSPLTFHFMSTVDPDHVRDILTELDPETTLFIISSKSFTTIETLTNARTALTWLTGKLGTEALAAQVVAVTANKSEARKFGISETAIFTFPEGVGGRYSIWSAIGLPLVLMLGTKQYNEFLLGARLIDKHFQEAPLDQNIPVTLALLSIWYANFFAATTEAIIPYSYRLRSFVNYIQQLAMESNGKSVTHAGAPIAYATSPIIFGEEGCNSQHSFYQLLHQGRHLIPIDFILVTKPHPDANTTHHDIVTASALSQSYAFTHGKTQDEAALEQTELSAEDSQLLATHRAIAGNKPNNLLMLDKLTPQNLGALIAIYEHKIFIQSIIWDINPFDQWGVELGKQNLPSILKQFASATECSFSDVSTHHLIMQYKKIRGTV